MDCHNVYGIENISNIYQILSLSYPNFSFAMCMCVLNVCNIGRLIS